MDDRIMVDALGALAHETRLTAYRLLRGAGEAGLRAGAIAEALSIPPNSLSSHLAIMARAGVISQRRQGRMIIYRASGDTVAGLADALKSA